MPLRAALTSFAAFLSLALLAGGVAVADSVTTNFEQPTFHTGSVNGQDGWQSAARAPITSCDPSPTFGQIDQEVVQNAGAPAAFGAQSLRLSNLCGTRDFDDQTYSTSVAPAGERLTNTEYTGQFSFISKTPNTEQPGLDVTVSPDSGEGSRMAWVGLQDTSAGIKVTASDSPTVDGEFVDYDLGVLDRKVPHTIKFWIKLNPGLDNDLVRIYIDGQDVGQCFTTWENYYRTSPEQEPPPNANNPATIDSLQFRTSVQGPAALATTGGYLFDNVTTTTANGAGPRGCNLPIDKTADQSTVSPGGLAGYQLSVRNRGSTVARNVRLCDRIPRHTTFVRANHALTRVGNARCLLIPKLAPGQRAGFHIDLRVDANAPPGKLTNIADITPGVPPITPRPDAPGSGADLPSNATPAPPQAIEAVKEKVKAAVRVLAKRAGPRRGQQPSFTG